MSMRQRNVAALAPPVARGTTDRYFEVVIKGKNREIVNCGDVATVRLVGLDGDVFSGELV